MASEFCLSMINLDEVHGCVSQSAPAHVISLLLESQPVPATPGSSYPVHKTPSNEYAVRQYSEVTSINLSCPTK